MATILYLDSDDEITTAAARIRDSVDPRVALVLPPGSRLATSRMNFRLLAREALERNRGLSIVAADPAARSIAASAGLAAYATVGEFEGSIAQPQPPLAPDEMPVDGTPAGGSSPSPSRQAATILAADSAARAAATAATTAAASAMTPPASEPRARSGAASLPVVPGTRSGRGGGRRLAFMGIVVALVAALGVAGYLVLPSATVVVTPRPENLGPIEIPVRADPDATAVDAVAGIVPATRLSHDFNASGEFPATGQRVVQEKAKGTLRWTNCDPTRAYRIPAGTSAKTGGGIGFATDEAVFLPVAILNPPNISCQSREVGATAVKAGTGGNVDAGTVTIVPASYNSVVIKVTNPAAMAGGTREEFTRVSQKDIDAALAELTRQLQDQFVTWSGAPDELGAGATAFPSTGTLAEPVPSPDPATLLNVEAPTFQLQLSTSGTVVTVETELVEQVANERVISSIPAGHSLRKGSVAVTVGEGQADGAVVGFRATASAETIPTLDPAQLRAEIKGMPVDEARRILERYGSVTIELWPGFASTIPTLDARLELTIGGIAGTAASPSPDGTPAP